jgi:hypothetical protein
MHTNAYVSTSRAVGSGILGALISGLFLVGLGPRLGLGNLDYPRFLGTFYSGGLGLPETKSSDSELR